MNYRQFKRIIYISSINLYIYHGFQSTVSLVIEKSLKNQNHLNFFLVSLFLNFVPPFSY